MNSLAKLRNLLITERYSSAFSLLPAEPEILNENEEEVTREGGLKFFVT